MKTNKMGNQNIFDILGLNNEQEQEFVKDYHKIIKIFNEQPLIQNICAHHKWQSNENVVYVKCWYRPINDEIVITEFIKFNNETEYLEDIRKESN